MYLEYIPIDIVHNIKQYIDIISRIQEHAINHAVPL